MPHLVERIGDKRVNAHKGHRVISKTVSAQMMAMLRDVVSAEGGTGAAAKVPGYTVAGKTGTAAKPVPGGYSTSRYVASFVGVVPAKSPRLVVLVQVDEPRGAIWGGVVAAPAFAEIARSSLVELEIARMQTLPSGQGAKRPFRGLGAIGIRSADSDLPLGSVPPDMELERLVAALAPEAVLGSPDPVEVRDLAYDARAVTPGAAFFAVPGEHADGHDFAAQAVENGAVALVVEHAVEPEVPQLVVPSTRAAMATAADAFFGEPTRELEVAGVTGTSGKTTTAYLLYSVLEAAGRRPGLLGTVESRVGGEVRPVVRTTPEAIDLQRTFREMLDAGNRSVALEASSHASVLRRLDRVRFDALVFTNLSQDHLDFHESMEDYFAAKRKLFTGAAPTPAAVNIGDEWGRRLAEELAFVNRAPLITFGLADDAEIRPAQLELGATGARFTAGGIEIESNSVAASTSRTSSA